MTTAAPSHMKVTGKTVVRFLGKAPNWAFPHFGEISDDNHLFHILVNRLMAGACALPGTWGAVQAYLGRNKD